MNPDALAALFAERRALYAKWRRDGLPIRVEWAVPLLDPECRVSCLSCGRLAVSGPCKAARLGPQFGGPQVREHALFRDLARRGCSHVEPLATLSWVDGAIARRNARLRAWKAHGAPIAALGGN